MKLILSIVKLKFIYVFDIYLDEDDDNDSTSGADNEITGTTDVVTKMEDNVVDTSTDTSGKGYLFNKLLVYIVKE